ncbi:prepilin-type N-terminal cleavage/methylation domain protein [Lyngbya aestuarii BL J]|uniref:Prepilin-type N-terminal cleavage/methylation domain protein n=1 Tax=Lyngbya aestuarii BL J TaxID=1348334 RepID=U7QBU4_9CYAN|nr:type IV pilin-like G/H family protein [Lyngbya aestuarii]ERT04475.1 prepilin-type N-terminal cleavage/methylation domain protein [Lyngbya aestuarii BL J]
MKTEFKAKFLQHVAKRKKEEGFTLIELLVVIIIIGILSAIALPSFLNQANKAKESEAKQYLSAINKGQQAYYTENSKFTSDIASLGVGIKTATENFSYVCADPGDGGINCKATATGDAIRSYLGAVYLISISESETTSRSMLCQTLKPGEDPTEIAVVDVVQLNSPDPTCPGGMTDV